MALWRSRKANRSGHVTVIAADVQVEGNLWSKGTMAIHGRVNGDIHHEGRLVVAKGARCTGHISAVEMEIAGVVMGNATVTDRLEIQAGGRLHGDVVCGRLVVQDGAVFDGTASGVGLPEGLDAIAAMPVEPVTAAGPVAAAEPATASQPATAAGQVAAAESATASKPANEPKPAKEPEPQWQGGGRDPFRGAVHMNTFR